MEPLVTLEKMETWIRLLQFEPLFSPKVDIVSKLGVELLLTVHQSMNLKKCWQRVQF